LGRVLDEEEVELRDTQSNRAPTDGTYVPQLPQLEDKRFLCTLAV